MISQYVTYSHIDVFFFYKVHMVKLNVTFGVLHVWNEHNIMYTGWSWNSVIWNIMSVISYLFTFMMYLYLKCEYGPTEWYFSCSTCVHWILNHIYRVVTISFLLNVISLISYLFTFMVYIYLRGAYGPTKWYFSCSTCVYWY